jgi:hypothetical protein
VPGPTVDRPIVGADLTFNLDAAAMMANHPIATERLVVVIGDGDVNIKVKVIGWEHFSFHNNKRKAGGRRRRVGWNRGRR